MSLNPVQFGKEVIDQFGRYLLTTFPIADERIAQQVRNRLRFTVDDDALLYKGPYVYLNRPFQQGPAIADLIQKNKLHEVMAKVFEYPSLHYHQGEALNAVQSGQNLILSTGTGSGKTEAFMLPIINHALQLRDRKAPDGITAVIIYPMNALVNDQLERLRRMLAGTGVTFGRYTGETERKQSTQIVQQPAPVPYTNLQLEQYKERGVDFGSEALPLPWEECYTVDDIRERRPRILLTNYAQLEYLLLRDKDLQLFRNAPLQFIVFDEVHTYTGALGSEVACLVRRLRDIAGKSSSDVTMIGTSATVSDDPDEESGIDTEAMTRRFAHRLFGVPENSIAVVRETYRPMEARDTYLPALPDTISDYLAELLQETRELQLQTDIDDSDISERLVELASYLCQQEIPGYQSRNDLIANWLYHNECVMQLIRIFEEPRTWDEAIPIWKQLGEGRRQAEDSDLISEMLAYLTLGVLIEYDGDPLLRPKLHYFVQGLQGLSIHFSAHRDPVINFVENEEEPPLMLCRSCGQHYTRLITSEWEASDDSSYGYRLARPPRHFEDPTENTDWLYLTDQFHTSDEADDGDWQTVFLCTACNTIHQKHEPKCLNPHCRQEQTLIHLQAYKPDDAGMPTKCGACAAPNTEQSRMISYTRSAAVADVTILAQSMLTMMSEPSLRKVLIFTDSRQEAAFQAGWMQQRSKRFRLRHIAYQVAKDIDRPTNWRDFTQEIVSRAQSARILDRRAFDDENNQTFIRWFLIEEFAYVTQRRSNLEQLGLIEIIYAGLHDTQVPFIQHWSEQFGIQANELTQSIQLILDYYRRRGLLSDPLLARWWGKFDREIYQGLISVPDYFRPSTLVRDGSDHTITRNWVASNGRAATQVMLDAMLPNVVSGQRDRFLKELWNWLIEAEYLVPVEPVQRQRGDIRRIRNLPSRVYQVNVEMIGLQKTTDRYECQHCHRAQQVMTPTGKCPEYRCKGYLEYREKDLNHFDVYQYELQEFVPLQAQEHSAQVEQERRLEAEREFKNDNGEVNVIVATPTLEMGVDIGKLEMVMMRNVPPTPANYAQRAGRAGRRHRIGVVFSYAGASQHDRYFYAQPPEAIAGTVRIPAFSMQNEPLIRKHVHSTVLTALREWANVDEKTILQEVFPHYISHYIAEWVQDGDVKRPRFYNEARQFPKFSQVIQKYHARLLERLNAVFRTDWSVGDETAVDKTVLETYLNEMAYNLETQVRLLFNQVKAYRDSLSELRSIEDAHGGLRADEKKTRQRLENARDSYLRNEIGNYTLSWLANNGFFPGYALSRDSVQATCIDPFLELSRPSSIALRELTPANWVYADGKIFSVQRLNFGKLRADNPGFTSDMLVETMEVNRQTGRITIPEQQQTEGGQQERELIQSYQLVDVEMEQLQNIDDRSELRRRIAFDIQGMLLQRHNGGEGGRVGEKRYQKLHQETVRLVNLGPTRIGPTGIQGFPLCPICGETRSPNATSEEINRFRDRHRERCNVLDIQFHALHVEIQSDVLFLGPYNSRGDAANVYEGLLAGARNVLDMGGNELDGFYYVGENEAIWAVIYDPLPGGTGFIDQLVEYWDQVCESGIQTLFVCDCDEACYKCLQHFRNQYVHDELNRHLAMELLTELRGDVYKEHEIPARVQHMTNLNDVSEKTESWAEDRFLDVLDKYGHDKPPEAQFRIDLRNGNYTVADFAYPDKKILVYIDGTSANLHGDPMQARNDRRKRTMLRADGWNVIEITAQALDDEQAMAIHLDDLSIYLSL